MLARITRIFTIGAALTCSSCAVSIADFEMQQKGYASSYDRARNLVLVTMTAERVNTMGGPESEESQRALTEIVDREHYCRGRERYVRQPPRLDRNYWHFPGYCSNFSPLGR